MTARICGVWRIFAIAAAIAADLSVSVAAWKLRPDATVRCVFLICGAVLVCLGLLRRKVASTVLLALSSVNGALVGFRFGGGDEIVDL